MGHQQDTGAKASRGITHATTTLTQRLGIMKGAGWNPAPFEARSAERRTKCEAAKQPFHPFTPDKVLTMCPEQVVNHVTG